MSLKMGGAEGHVATVKERWVEAAEDCPNTPVWSMSEWVPGPPGNSGGAHGAKSFPRAKTFRNGSCNGRSVHR